MSNERLYVDFHIIQTVPPSCVNRDDTGRPKTAIYGGANRARVSSQAWKHAMRKMFGDILAEDKLGYRTKYLVKPVVNSINKMSDDITAEKAEKMAITALTNAGLKVKEKKGNSVDALFFISHVQADKLAELAVTGEKDKNLYKIALKENPSIDIALFGRMVASDPEMNYDAAAQVAHSISTHAVQTEYDYFTAVDDCSPEDNAGAGHLGTMEFNSATLYRYATVNVSELYKNIGVEDAANAVKGFAEAFIRSMPTGKQNSYANGTLPDTVYVTVRNDQPVNLCGAFEKPIYSNCGYAEKSAEELFKYADRVYENFCGKPTCSFVIGNADNSDIGKVNLNELLDALYDYIANGVV